MWRGHIYWAWCVSTVITDTMCATPPIYSLHTHSELYTCQPTFNGYLLTPWLLIIYDIDLEQKYKNCCCIMIKYNHASYATMETTTLRSAAVSPQRWNPRTTVASHLVLCLYFCEKSHFRNSEQQDSSWITVCHWKAVIESVIALRYWSNVGTSSGCLYEGCRNIVQASLQL